MQRVSDPGAHQANWHGVLYVLWATVFGAAAAAGSILLARRADVLSDGTHPDELERDHIDGLLAAERGESALLQDSRSAQR